MKIFNTEKPKMKLFTGSRETKENKEEPVKSKMKLFSGSRETEEKAIRVRKKKPILHKCKYDLCKWKDICVEDLEANPIKCGRKAYLKYRPCVCFCTGRSPHLKQDWMD